MIVVRDIDALPGRLRMVVTVGVFDGVHRGHHRVIGALTEAARELAAASLVMTFDPHPDVVVRGIAPRLLCDIDERLARLERAGADLVVVQRFDDAFRSQTAAAFLDRLRSGRELRGLVMSHESAFGHDRQGTIGLVRGLADAEGWRLVEVPVEDRHGARVSSGRIRALIEAGRLADARDLLGRRPALRATIAGRVTDGELELRPDTDAVLPPPGSYAVRLGPPEVPSIAGGSDWSASPVPPARAPATLGATAARVASGLLEAPERLSVEPDPRLPHDSGRAGSDDGVVLVPPREADAAVTLGLLLPADPDPLPSPLRLELVRRVARRGGSRDRGRRRRVAMLAQPPATGDRVGPC